MAYGMTSVGYEDDQLYAAICERAVELLPELDPPQVALIMWALGEQAYWHKPFLAGRRAARCRAWAHVEAYGTSLCPNDTAEYAVWVYCSWSWADTEAHLACGYSDAVVYHGCLKVSPFVNCPNSAPICLLDRF